uniref:Transcriptional regulator, XRE family n=1 Tax=Cyanothece sp. (strain PCC 7425 / ATCC 29141) TaxID=395961 RepID=B8HLU5_CYAP4
MQNRLKELRQRRSWSQADLARSLGISRQAVNGFESGKFDPSLEMAFKIARLFNVAIEDVFVYEARHSMPTLVERVKNFLGFEFGFERFTDKAINAIQFARNQATELQQCQSGQVEPEHLLAGLLADPTTTSARLLRSSGMKLEIKTDEHSFEALENPKISQPSKFVLELALQAARLRGKKSIGTEHLLWGLVQLAETDNTLLNELFQRYEVNLVTLKNQLAATI